MTSTTRWLGEYEIVRRLRIGGMATLYLARKHGAAGFTRLAVIKVIHPHLLDQPQFIEMFIDEARICSQLSHPNVIHIEEFGEIDGQHYIVMEYIDGCSVHELLQTPHRHGARTMPPEIAAHIIMQVARGLHAAHECAAEDLPLEVIHRDITPSNILVSMTGHVKVIDFGIAKAKNRLSETESGFALKGKYRYVAPEQATPTTLDRRTDIFGLGVVFWELLTGQHLFLDDHIGLFNRLNETIVAPPSSKNPASPPALDPIVLAMLQHDREHRPATAAEVVRLIANALPAATAVESQTLATYVAEARTHRETTRAGTEERAVGDQSFSATPRPHRSFTSPPTQPQTYRIEVTPPAHLEPEPPADLPTEAFVRPGAPAPRRKRWIALGAALVGVSAAIAFLIVNAQSNDLVKPVVTAPAPIEGRTLTPAPAPPVTRPAPPPVTKPAPTVTRPEPTAVVAVPTPRPVAPVTRPAPKRVAAKRARPTAVATTVPAPVPASPAPARAKRTGKFVDTPFDDATNTPTSAAAPARTKVKKTTIITDFGN